MASLKEIEQQALRLAAEERARLAKFLLESVRPPLSDIEAAWTEGVMVWFVVAAFVVLIVGMLIIAHDIAKLND